MPTFRYRAVLRAGDARQGTIVANDLPAAIDTLRAGGVTPVEVRPVADARGAKRGGDAKLRAASAILFGELAILLLRAGLPLDRALGLAIENVEPKTVAARFASLLAEVREGRPFSAALADADISGPAEVAMIEAGEANGDIADALTRVAAMLEGAAELRRLIVTALIYPVALLAIAVAVVLLMLLFVVPQFEGLMASGRAALPASSRFVLDASRGLQDHGLLILLGLAGAVAVARIMLARPAARTWFDRMVLRVPQVGALILRAETARFARTLGALVEGQVALPNAMLLARRTIGNRHIGFAVQSVADGVREGGGLAAPLAATRVLPDLAIGFIRTGEESSQLGPMLTRLAEVLDRDVRLRLARMVAVLTPAITIVLGGVVTAIIAAIMSAILGFNELAIAQ